MASYRGGQILSSHDEEWEYAPGGMVKCTVGACAGLTMTWNGHCLQPTNSSDYGEGTWDGFNLNWRGRDGTLQHYIYNYSLCEYQAEGHKTWKWTRHFLASKDDDDYWSIEGSVPKPIIMMLQILRRERLAGSGNPS